MHGLNVLFFDLDGMAIDAGLLSVSEQARVARKATASLRQRQAASFCMVRRVLGELLELPGEHVPIQTDPEGKPRLGQGMTLHFNPSHSGGVGMIAWGPRELGADVEALIARPRDALAREILHPRELDDWAMLPEERRQSWLTRAWTRKEAVLKAVGSGLRIPPRQLDVGGGADEGSSWQIQLEDRDWIGVDWLHGVPEGHRAAVCIEASPDAP